VINSADGSVPMMLAQVRSYDGDAWIDWTWVGDHLTAIREATQTHLVLTLQVVVLGVVLALPLALVSARRPLVRSVVLGASSVMYTIPSLAAFALLIPYTGLTSRWTVLIPLVSYTLVVLLRNFVSGLDAVPTDARAAADGLGFSPAQRLLRVELPLAVPAMMAGVRLATVSTIGLVTVSAIIGQQSLGLLIRDGLERDFRTLVVVGAGLALVLAVLSDLALYAIARALTPWQRRR
jgi:osmoprotectant transport system permease protein